MPDSGGDINSPGFSLGIKQMNFMGSTLIVKNKHCHFSL